MTEPVSIKGFINIPDLFDDQAIRQQYTSRWSLRPLLDRNNELSLEERAFLEAIEVQFANYHDKPQGVGQVPLSEAEIDRLIRFFFPPFQPKHQYGALARPMAANQIFVTPAWFDILQSGRMSVGREVIGNSPVVRAGMLILSQHYDQELPYLRSDVIDYFSEEEGLASHFVIMPGLKYVDVVINGDKPKLSRNQIRELLANPDKPELWLERLPQEVFSFSGVEVNQAVDLTQQVAQSRLQHLLLKREAVLSPERIEQLTEVLRNLLRVKDLKIGIHALDFPRDLSVKHRYLIRRDFLANRIEDVLDPELGETIYTETCRFGKTRIFDDLASCLSEGDPISDAILSMGYRSLVLVPLYGKGKQIITGFLQLGSKKSFAFNNLVITQLEVIAPLFRQAINRTRGDMEFRIQSVMRKNFTSLDQSVEWKFIEAAAELIDQESSEDDVFSSTPEIRFENIWALYGQADIVGSSKLRNEAIRKDMIAELNAAIKLLEAPAINLIFPLAGKLAFDGKKLLARLIDEMSPNDEQQVQRFLAVNFAPTLKQLGETKEAKQRVETYQQELATTRENGITNRQAYEESVSRLSKAISKAITSSEEEAQRIIPHYFSKYRTDGIEFNIYAGQSLLPEGNFTKVHLQNLRLWQLQTLINVTKSVAGLQSSLPMKMTTAQLIFAFGQPITIQFRMDEKRFDVEGAYNVRYEIIKKRIDKAIVKDTDQRLTLPNHIAVVYTHITDRKVYLELLQYLSESGQVEGEVEELELESMQGVDGLMALRVKVL